VIKVESRGRIDPLRTLGPFKDGKGGAERSISYHKPEPRKTVRRNQSQGTAWTRSYFAPRRLGRRRARELHPRRTREFCKLDYEHLKKRKDNIIIGVHQYSRDRPGRMRWAPRASERWAAAMSGASDLIGWPDRPPWGTFGPWTDGVAPRFIVPSILAALHRKSRTGEGCYIDIAQAEAGIQFVAARLLRIRS